MNETILAGWQRLVAGKDDIDLLSMYKGMPVIYKARVQYVHNDSVHIQPQSFKSMCLMLSKSVIALSELLDEPLNAEIQAVNLGAGTAVLGNFSYVSGHLGDRMSPRVEPREPIEVKLETGGRGFVGTVIDLSISGAGIFVAGEGAHKLRTRSIVRFSLPLPEETLNLLGVIRHAKRTTQGSRLGIAYEPGTNLRAVFTYINYRRAELLEELEKLYDNALV
ncbi:MAG TPA: PilZ domain-containing protein [Anaerolineales bacterium]|nr:PilZ domain-containing protein [Anaerolineales bacterium]